jgi:hypothetical protein
VHDIPSPKLYRVVAWMHLGFIYVGHQLSVFKRR